MTTNVAHATGPTSCVFTLERRIRADGTYPAYIKGKSTTSGSVHSYMHEGSVGFYGVVVNGTMTNARGTCFDDLPGEREGNGVDGSISIDRWYDGTYACGYNDATGYFGAGMRFTYAD